MTGSDSKMYSDYSAPVATDTVCRLQTHQDSCFYCRRVFRVSLTGLRKTYDRIVPLHYGGNANPPNLVYACERCKNLKKTLTLESFKDKVEKSSIYFDDDTRRLVLYAIDQLREYRSLMGSELLIDSSELSKIANKKICRLQIDRHRCFYCKRIFEHFNPGYIRTIDHIIPKSGKGKDNHFNRVFACDRCNNFKGSMTLHQFKYEVERSSIFKEENTLENVLDAIDKLIVYEKQMGSDLYRELRPWFLE